MAKAPPQYWHRVDSLDAAAPHAGQCSISAAIRCYLHPLLGPDVMIVYRYPGLIQYTFPSRAGWHDHAGRCSGRASYPVNEGRSPVILHIV